MASAKRYKFGPLYRALLDRADLSQADVEAKTGISGSHVGSIKRGVRRPKLAELDALLSAVDATKSERLHLTIVANEDHENWEMLGILDRLSVQLAKQTEDVLTLRNEIRNIRAKSLSIPKQALD